MTAETLAAAILRDVPRFNVKVGEHTDPSVLLLETDILAALSRAMSDDLTERAGEVVERRMEAYYYGFDATGVAPVDKILSAVACAGKAYHHTGQWEEECVPYDDHTGASPVSWIQNAGKEAADLITAFLVQNAALTARVEGLTGALQKIGTLAPIEKPPEPYDENGWQVADTSDRHASMVAAKDMWEVADFARATLSTTTEEGK